MLKFIVLLFLGFASLCSLAQQSDSQLAYTYYQNREYDKAAELFLKLYERTRSSSFLDYHIICLINAKQYDQAEEVLKKYLKTDSNNKEFLINLGYIYEQQGKNKKAEEYYEKAIRKLIPQHGDIQNLAYKFRNIREYSWAIKTYLRGRELLKQPEAFQSELADNYMMERDYDRMFELFIRLLRNRPSEINNVTSKLSFARSYDLVNSIDDVIEKNLAVLLRPADHLPVFDELAVWYALQKSNYTQALQHATLLNQKTSHKLQVYLSVAREAMNGKAYATALEAYSRVVEKGKTENPYYDAARKEILRCAYQECLHRQAPVGDYQPIVESCKRYLQEYGYVSAQVDVAVLLSDLYAYQLQQPDSANRILEKSIQIRRLNPNTLSMLKLKRADLLAFMNNPWEAVILYTQVEKSNPNNDTGYEAKLKKAWLAYYTGDLLWAKAQFDVLKGATSKLISNDALRISHFINMNYEAEGDNTALERLAQAEYYLYRQQTEAALVLLDSLIQESAAAIAEQATLRKAQLLRGQRRYEEAASLLENVKTHSAQTYLRAEAIYELARLRTEMQQPEQARELYKLLVSEYSGSVYSVEAGKLYREIEKHEHANYLQH